jgi:hypothetical protein
MPADGLGAAIKKWGHRHVPFAAIALRLDYFRVRQQGDVSLCLFLAQPGPADMSAIRSLSGDKGTLRKTQPPRFQRR